jgi:membrane protein YdbS with pleckstrin-like domain
VSDVFSPPGVRWQRVAPQLATLRRLVMLAWMVPIIAAWVVLALVLELPAAAVVAGLVGLVLVAGWAWWLIGRIVRNWGYAEREEDLYIVHGALRRRLVVVPYGRMQYADVQAGPLDQLAGLASVQLHTASPATHARIPGLPAAEAARLRDRLTELGDAGAAGL